MKILLVSPFLANPPTNGAKARIFAVIEELMSRGHEVHVVYTGFDGADSARATENMEPICSGFFDISDANYERPEPDADGHGIDSWVSEQQIRDFISIHETVAPDATIVNYIFQSVFLEHISSVKVIDLHDRLARAEQYEAINEQPNFFFTSVEREITAVSRADLALCIQENERTYFEQSGTPIFTFGHVLPRQYINRRYDRLRNIGYIGAYNIFNIHALTEFLAKYAEVVSELPEVRVKVGGMICAGIPDYPFVDKLGRVPTLRGFYEGIDLAINPTVAGTGLKIKSVEALSYGVPMVSTSSGSDGLPIKTPLHTLDGPDDVVQQILEVKRDEFRQLTKLANLAKVAHTEYSQQQSDSIDRCLSFIAARLRGRREKAKTIVAPRSISTFEPASLSGGVLHILNPFDAPESSDNYVAQPITFQSISDAKACSQNYVHADVVSITLKGERPVSHPIFSKSKTVRRTSKDLLPDYRRKLPVLSELLGVALDSLKYDWVVYTNVDIAVMPMFYRRIAEYAANGHDAIIINRRTISKHISGVDQISEAYGQIGVKHPGFDCFVFKRELLEKFELFDTLVGVHLIGRMLIWNIFRHARKPHVEKEEHLTFHIGDDVPSKDLSEVDAIAHNFHQAERFWDSVEKAGDLEKLRLKAVRSNAEDALNFGVGQLVTPTVHTSFDTRQSRPVLLHGHYRCGSTFIFRQLRKQPGNLCFYEPLHEDIDTFKRGNLTQKRERHKPSTFHKEHDGGWLFEEFEPLITEHGVPHFSADLGTEHFGSTAPSERLDNYVESLLSHSFSSGKRPVLQFNRTGLRIDYFKQNFPDAEHFFIMRSIEDQWGSYIRFLSGDRRGFLRSMLAGLGRSKGGDKLSDLQTIIPLFQSGTDFNLHQTYDTYFDTYTIEELYVAFYYIWLMAVIDAVVSDVTVIPLSEIRHRPSVQARLDAELVRCGMAIDWSQLKDEQYLVPESEQTRRKLYEAPVNTLMLERYGQNGLEALRSVGLTHVADRIEKNTAVDPLVQSFFDYSVSVEGVQQRCALFPQVRGIRDFEKRDKPLARILETPQDLPAIPLEPTSYGVNSEWFEAVNQGSVGWSVPEDGHVWSTIRESILAFRLPQLARSLKIRMSLRPSESLISKEGRYLVKANGINVAEGSVLELAESGLIEFDLGGALLTRGRNGAVSLSVVSSEAADPVGQDIRKLFFVLFKIDFELSS